MLTDICCIRTGREKGNMNITQHLPQFILISQVVLAVKKPACQCNAGDTGSIAGLGRSSGEGNGNPLQDSYLENSMGQRSHGIQGYSPLGHKRFRDK